MIRELIEAVDRAPSWKDWQWSTLVTFKAGDSDAAPHDCTERMTRAGELLKCSDCGAEFERKPISA